MNDTGERFWHHRKKAAVKYNPTSLHKTLVDYFDWATDNPLIELKAFSFQGDSWDHASDKARVFTLEGLLTFTGLSKKMWAEFGEDEKFAPLVEWAALIIYQQKFELAAVDLLNAGFIARDLGLADAQKIGGIPGKPLEISHRETLIAEFSRLTKLADEGRDDGAPEKLDGKRG